MAKYQNANLMARELEDDEEIEKLENEMREEREIKEIENQKVGDPEEESFKKRYADLRRHLSAKELAWEKEKESLNSRINEVAREGIQLPTTEEDLEAFAKKYPDVVKIIETIAAKRYGKDSEQVTTKIKEMEAQAKRAKEQQAWNEFTSIHPDFVEIRTDPDFVEWVEKSHPWVKKALYENTTDARLAADAVSKYKMENPQKFRKEEEKAAPKKDNRDAARSVKTSTKEAPKASQKYKYSESLVDRMSRSNPRWYDENEAAIDEAIRNGEFLFDMTTGAE